MLQKKLTDYGLRTFNWKKSYDGNTEMYSCVPVVTDEQLLKFDECTCRIRFNKNAEWQIVGKGHKLAYHGHTETIEEAVLELMRKFYTRITEDKFLDAAVPKIGRKIVITGNHVKYDEFHAAAFKDRCRTIQVDSRNDCLFVIGWPKIEKEEYVAFIAKIKSPPGYIRLNPFNTTITTEEGLKLNECLDWRMYQIHENVTGEVYCQICKNLFGSVQQMNMRNVTTIGPLCGPCIDHLQIDCGYDFEGLIDV